MGMFDYYRPNISFCPLCESVLDDWQGKDGPCGLFIWKEGETSPIDQKVDDECKISIEKRSKIRLPQTFIFYTSCESNHSVTAVGRTVEETWVESKITYPELDW